MKRFPLLVLSLFWLSACSSGFVYQGKTAPARDGLKVPMKVAVLAFEDNTGEFTKHGSFLSGYVYNLSRSGINGLALGTGAAFNVSPLPAVIWGKDLAEDMKSSGAFRSVKFLFSASEVTDEDVVVEGALMQAYFHTKTSEPDEFDFHLTVRRMPGKAVAWEGDVRRRSPRPGDLTSGCIMGTCVVDRIHTYLNGVMQGMFADARRDLVLALAAPPKKKSAEPGRDSPEEVIRKILGKP